MAKKDKTKFITKDILRSSILGAFQKLDLRYMIKNPVMFVVEIGFLFTLVLTVFPTLFGGSEEYRVYNGVVTVVLFVTCYLQTLQSPLQKEEERHRQLL